MEYTVQEASSRKGKGGPKTAQGKARSALNAVTHGLTARAPVALWFEAEEAWTPYRAGIVASLAPVGDSEHDLAEKIALTLWRQNRVAAYETHRTNLALSAAPGEVERDLRHDHTEADAEVRMRAKLTERLLLGDLELLKLQRYESHLGRELSRLFKHFHHLQDRRRTQPREAAPRETPPPHPCAPLPGSRGSGDSIQPDAPLLAGTSPTVVASPAPAAPSSSPLPEASRASVRGVVSPAASRLRFHPFLQNELNSTWVGLSRHDSRPTSLPPAATPTDHFARGRAVCSA